MYAYFYQVNRNNEMFEKGQSHDSRISKEGLTSMVRVF